jgi:hypothetical protein
MSTCPRLPKETALPSPDVGRHLDLLLKEQTAFVQEMRRLIQDLAALASCIKATAQPPLAIVSSSPPSLKCFDCPHFCFVQESPLKS